MTMRRALIITAIVLFLLASIAAVYFVFFAKKGGTLTVGGPTSFPQGGSGGPSVTLGQGAGTVVAPRLLKITDGPVAQGFSLRSVMLPAAGDASTSAPAPDVEVRYVDRASGNVYAFDVHSRVLARLSNKTLPGIEQASWTADGSMAFVQYLAKDANSNEHVATYALPADGTGTGYTLEDNLAEVVTASTTVATLAESTTGSIATLAKADGTGAHTLFSTLLSQLFIKPGGSAWFAYTPASAQLDGYAFELDGKTGALDRLLGPLRGLSILPSPSGKTVLYSYVQDGAPRLAVIDVASHAATLLPLGTLAEKCAWTADSQSLYCAVPTNLTGTLPDDWYQGSVTFSDRIWRIDLAGRVATMVLDTNALAKTPVDAISLTLDPQSDVLVFMDKATGSLWSYDLP